MKLIDILKQEYIKIPLFSTSKEEVVRELIDILTPFSIYENHDLVYSAIMAREAIMTTGVGKGVAIPHCKKNECKEFAIALGIHPQGVDYQSIDGKPAQIFFLLIGPETNPGMHIRLLSRISRLISKDMLREKLLSCSSASEAYHLIKTEEEKYFEIAS
ncbi:hypothetical protein B1H10_04915 [candidate division KSB1 bacterium 4484_188]|nr:MAG: hypothetical protein B1H10_04915 [candidate division KSB1 bacterium 4484_188]HFE65132.1 PTS sugar transporter subunit IIA [Caldithrix sp.]